MISKASRRFVSDGYKTGFYWNFWDFIGIFFTIVDLEVFLGIFLVRVIAICPLLCQNI
jgi:hypothetical protein